DGGDLDKMQNLADGSRLFVGKDKISLPQRRDRKSGFFLMYQIDQMHNRHDIPAGPGRIQSDNRKYAHEVEQFGVAAGYPVDVLQTDVGMTDHDIRIQLEIKCILHCSSLLSETGFILSFRDGK